jgi:exodeoxyribonuclease VII large subunit
MSNRGPRDLLIDEAVAPRAAALPVSLFVSSARLIVERHLGLVWVSGEVSNFSRAASGHCYFVLKDDQAQVRCVMYRQKAQLLGLALRDGEQIEVRATPTIYEARGEFQLTVETVRRSGFGALYERFARLKARLEAAGWFATARKRELPAFPRAIGIVTSPRAAALSDVLATLKRRLPSLPVILYPASVQGEGAAKEIATAIAAANAHAKVDALIVCRGGGSIEDLWAFNEEIVARAVLESRLPIVSGVGHESDFTICDFVADARAPTPTAAAAMVAPDRTELLSRLLTTARRWGRTVEGALERRMQHLDHASRRLVHPAARLAQQRERLERAAARWQRATAMRVESIAQRLGRLEAGLKHLSPQNVLDRGYSIVTSVAGAIVHDAAQIAVGDEIELTLARGGAGARITKTKTA